MLRIIIEMSTTHELIVLLFIFALLQVLKSTIQRDLSGINVKVREAFKALREERVKLIREKAKEVLGRDVEISLKDVDTDVNVKPDFNQLVTTNGIVSSLLSLFLRHTFQNIQVAQKQSGTRAETKTFWQIFSVLVPLTKL